MAIHYPVHKSPDWSAADNPGAWAVASGYRVLAPDTSGALNRRHMVASSFQMFQPSKMSRPGNLGTAYNGVWRGW